MLKNSISPAITCFHCSNFIVGKLWVWHLFSLHSFSKYAILSTVEKPRKTRSYKDFLLILGAKLIECSKPSTRKTKLKENCI